MSENQFAGIFEMENDILAKIEDLKEEGFEDEDIFIVTRDEDALSIVRGQTDVSLKEIDESRWDRFVAFISGDESVQSAISHMGLTDREAQKYINEVKNGKYLLYVDKEYGGRIHARKDDFHDGYTDPNLGGNTSVDNIDYAAIDPDSARMDAALDDQKQVRDDLLNNKKGF